MSVAISRSKLIALGVALALAALALLPGSWGTALAQTAGSPTPTACPTGTVLQADGSCQTPPVTIVSPSGGGTQTTTVTAAGATVRTDGRDFEEAPLAGSVSLTVPGGAMPPGTTVTATTPSTLSTSTRVVPGGFAGLPTTETTYTAFMSLTATDSAGNPITEDFDQPVTVRISTPITFASGLPTSTVVKVKNVNPTTGRVTEVTCTPVTDAASGIPLIGVYDCSLPHFSDWDLIVELVVPEGTDLTDLLGDLLPGAGSPEAPAGAPAPADTGMGAASASGATDPLAIALGVLALAGALGAGARLVAVRSRA